METSAQPDHNVFQPGTVANGQQPQSQIAAIIEQMFDEKPASAYVETLSDMLHHYLYTPRPCGIITPNHASDTTQVIHRLVRHITALSESVKLEHG
jgi:hypothetical protein